MHPRLIQVAGTNKLYMNKDLYDFIKQCMAGADKELVENDNIFFFKNVDFRRDKLQMSQQEFRRCIKMDKADAVVINTSTVFPSLGMYLLTDNSIVKNEPDDPSLIQDIVIGLSMLTTEEKEVIQQFFQLSQLPKLPKLINSANLTTFVNSGLIINEDNLDELIQILKGSPQTGWALIDACNPAKSLPYLLYLIYRNDFIKDRLLIENIPTVRRSQSMLNIMLGDQVSSSVLTKMREDPFLENLVLCKFTDLVSRVVTNSNIPTSLKNMFTVTDFEVKWN